MADPIRPIDISARRMSIEATQMRPAGITPRGTENKSFQEMLSEAVSEVRDLQTQADSTIKQLVSGELKDVTEAMVAVEKADVSFQTMMTVRTKVMTAYEEIMRMQI